MPAPSAPRPHPLPRRHAPAGEDANGGAGFGVPVLLIVFNRPDTTREVIDRLREVAPRRLFVFADGPRATAPADAARCQATRAVLRDIDWPCTVRKLLLTENAGCLRGVLSAVTWFFQQVPRGIILEDDCVPSGSFFPYCQALLERYDSDESVFHISGWSPHQGEAGPSYRFDPYMYCWGWASWSRAWTRFRADFGGIDAFLAGGAWRDRFDPETAAYLERRLGWPQRLRETWDIRWLYFILSQGGRCLTPAVNLVHNIGFPPDAPASRYRAADFDTGAMVHPLPDEEFTWARPF